MSKSRDRFLAAGVSALALLVTVQAPSVVEAASAPPQPAESSSKVDGKTPPSQPWAHEASDVPVDPSIRFGTLDNGLRFAIMRNATPPGQASIWLRIDAGSLNEKDDQLGLAHFMEHMAFNGTEDVPENELIHQLERLGLKFGADVNAATGYDQTFYRLDLPRIDGNKLDTGLHILRQQVSAATMDPPAIDAERGVIAGEERLRNSPSAEVGLKQIAILARGTRIPDRKPIGDMEIIRTAPRERFVDFYQAYYRPSRATVIAVGDFSVDEMEARIRRDFADWQPSAPDGPDLGVGRLDPPGQAFHVFTEESLAPSLTMSWVSAPELKPDTIAKRRDDWISYLARSVLQRRLSELSRSDDPPFATATAASDEALRAFRMDSIATTYFPDKWDKALPAAEQAVRQFVRFGVTQAELDREIRSLRTRLDQAVRSAPTRNTVQLAAAIEGAVNERTVVSSPQTDLAIFEQVVEQLDLAKVNAVAAKMFAGDGPVVLLNTTKPVEGGDQALARAFNASRAVEVAAAQPPVAKPWTYTNFGPKGSVVEISPPNALGAVTYRFANGTRLMFRHADFDKNGVSVALLTGIGEQNFASDKIDPRAAGVGNLFSGGLSDMTTDEIARSLNGHVVSGSIATLGQRFMLSGGTRPEDIGLQMQYLAAFMTDAALRSSSFDRVIATAPSGWMLANASPQGVYGLKVRPLLGGGDQRLAVAPPEVTSTWRMEPMRDDIRKMVGSGPIDLVVVGDIDAASVVDAVASTFGALPPRPPANAAPPGANIRTFPAPNAEPAIFTHKGLGEQALGVVAWPTTDVTGGRRLARELSVLRAIVQLRAIDIIREKEALAYSPGIKDDYSADYKGYGTLEVSAATAPDKLPAFYRAVEAIARDLQESPVSDDELMRARHPMVESQRQAMKTNGWWFRQLLGQAYRASTVDDALTEEADMMAVTPARIQELARQYLRMDKAFKASVLPDKAQPAT